MTKRPMSAAELKAAMKRLKWSLSGAAELLDVDRSARLPPICGICSSGNNLSNDLPGRHGFGQAAEFGKAIFVIPAIGASRFARGGRMKYARIAAVGQRAAFRLGRIDGRINASRDHKDFHVVCSFGF
jgi:hypothetical protein